MKYEKLERKYPEEWSDYSLAVVDKTLAIMFEDFKFDQLVVNNYIHFL